MKKLVFIDNATEHESNSWGDLDYLLNTLEDFGVFEYVSESTLEKIYQFGHLEESEAIKILFDKNNIICTWSTYCFAGVPYSGYQLFSFLEIAGKTKQKGIIYFDCSGEIVEALQDELNNQKELIIISNAIETNFILTKNKNNQIKRVRITVEENKGYNIFKITLEDIDLKTIL